MTRTDDRIDALLARMRQPGPVDDDPRDYEAMAEARHDPEADLERAEDMYERAMDRRWGE